MQIEDCRHTHTILFSLSLFSRFCAHNVWKSCIETRKKNVKIASRLEGQETSIENVEKKTTTILWEIWINSGIFFSSCHRTSRRKNSSSRPNQIWSLEKIDKSEQVIMISHALSLCVWPQSMRTSLCLLYSGEKGYNDRGKRSRSRTEILEDKNAYSF